MQSGYFDQLCLTVVQTYGAWADNINRLSITNVCSAKVKEGFP